MALARNQGKVVAVFSSIGWSEIFVILIFALIIIGPERLPGVIEDVRAAIFAARRAINNAKAELNGEFGNEFEELRAPITQLASLQRMGPKAAFTKAFLDGDEKLADAFDPKKMFSKDELDSGLSGRPTLGTPQASHTPSVSPPPQPYVPQPPRTGPQNRNFSWDDIT